MRSLLDRGETPRLVGQPAPDLSVRDDVKSLQLSKYRGQIVVLTFWATWCPPCAEEVPAMNAMQRELQGKVVILAVCTSVGDSPRCDQGSFSAFAAEHPMEFYTIRDETNRSNQIYGTAAFPESYVIDSHGVVRRKFVGPVEWNRPDILEYLKKVG